MSEAASKGLERWAHVVVRFRWLILAAWIVLFFVSMVASGRLPDLFRSEAGLPGTDAQRVNDVLEDEFGQKSYAGFTLVVRAREGTSASELLPTVEAAASRAAAAVDTGEVASVQTVSDRVVSATITTNLDVPDAQDFTAAARSAVGPIDGAETWLTGSPAIAADTQPVFEDDLKVGELYIALPAALAILVFVFGTLAFVLPFLFAFAAIPATLAVVWVFAHWMPMEQTVQNLVTFIGLGIAIDYSLLIVYRYREELRRSGGKVDALAQTLATAGHSVVFSGTAVAIGLALLIAMPVPGLRGYGVAGLVIPLVSIATALTLLPVLLYFAEARLDRVRLVPKRLLEHRESTHEDNLWLRLAHTIMRRPRLFAASALALLVLFALPLGALDLGPGTRETMPKNLESTQGLRVLSAAVGGGVLDPDEIVVDTGRAAGSASPQIDSAIGRLTAGLDAHPDVGLVVRDAGAAWINADGRYVRLQAIGRHEAGLPASEQRVRSIRDEVVPAADFPDGTRVLVGGAAAGGVDFIDRTYTYFPWLVVVVLLLTYVLLLRAFRSLLLPLKAIILNALSIAAAYGLLVAAFKWGLGEPLGLVGYDQITAWIPVFLFAMLFGLSMDYEVFLVSRMREEWDRTKDNAAAVSLGLAKTGRLVTAAGLIMFFAFMGLIVGSFVDLQQFGFGLAAAIIIDVTIVRALLLPSAMTLFGRWNWWLPASVARLVRVEPSPLEPKAKDVPERRPALAP